MGKAWLLVLVLVAGCGGAVVGDQRGNDGGKDGASDGPIGHEAVGPDGSRPLAPVSKVDLLFDINNTASSGDKQSLFAAAIPDLVTRLVQPNCITGTAIVGASLNGVCPAGSTIEFPPVHDLHIGIISTSLGSRGVTGGGEVCDPAQMTNNGMPFLDGRPAISSHTDDQAHLLNRASGAPVSTPPSAADLETETTSPDVGGQYFLDWFPTGAKWSVNAGKSATSGTPVLSPRAVPIGSAAQLESDFQAMVVGVHFYGCGIGSPIETWYRFLVQPDPYGSIGIDSQGLAQWSGVDATIIQQRHDFLRPDSLVVIIDVSDKDDQEIDVRSFGGQAYKFLDQTFQPPRGTSACATNPESPQCTSCAYPGHPDDPSCKLGPYTAQNDPGFYIGARTIHMKQKYGIDPQFPIGRYALGLTNPEVPDRDHEYPAGANCYQGGIGVPSCPATPPVGLNEADLNCTNPLFAASLPDGSDLTPTALCNLSGAGGGRTPDMIFYAHIGGVPHQLLQSKPGDSTGLCPKGTDPANCPQKTALTAQDWTKILGQGWATPPSPGVTNPNEYDYMGIDPHMIEAFSPRPGIIALTSAGPMGGGPDPISGADWVTNTTDPSHVLPVSLEYACIFPLGTPIDCSNAEDYEAQEMCAGDCSTSGLPLNAIPPVCGLKNPAMPYAMGTNDYTTKYYAKTYPTIRQIEIARLVGAQGSIASICPIHTLDETGTDPLYGFRPALTAIVNRLKPPPKEP